jgi:hypothetical protein
MLRLWVDILFYQVASMVDEVYDKATSRFSGNCTSKIALFLTSLDLSNDPSLISPLIICICSKWTPSSTGTII